MGAITDILSRFGPGRLAAMGAVTLALVGFFAFVIMRVSQPAMGVLFGELSAADAGAIMRDLDAKGIRYEARDEGATILAPRADLARIRMDLAGKALPSGGGVGYEIFDKGDAFSSTSFVQGINQLRALEGELSRTIRTIARVQGVRVHLAIPERRLFERDREPPRASIVLKVRGELGAEQVQAVRHLVASAVQGLSPDRVSIVDERGRLLADGTGSGQVAVVGSGSEDRRVALERRLRSQVEEIVAGIVGPGRSRVQVAAELDMNRIESRSENFDPESRVVRSSQTRGETSTSSGGEGQVSVGTELPGARDAAAATPGATPKDAANKTEEITNYEISRTTRTEVLEPGRLKRLSVAVLVDGTYARPAGGGEATYQPRSKEDLERIAALVRTAVGFETGRGDQVEVVNLPFAGPPAALEVEPVSLMASLLMPTREDVLRFGELGIIALLTVIVLFVVVRPMVKRVIAPDGGFGRAALSLVGGQDGQAALAGPDSRAPALADQKSGPDNGARALIGTLSGLEGSSAAVIQAEQISRIGELAAGEPRQAANLLRSWMNEP